jgi:hypothetical protein
VNPVTVWILLVSVAHAQHVRVEAYSTQAACKAEADRVLLTAARNVNNGWAIPTPHATCEKDIVKQ